MVQLGQNPAVRDPESTRLSQVTHYYFEDCVYYKPVHSDTALGEYVRGGAGADGREALERSLASSLGNAFFG